MNFNPESIAYKGGVITWFPGVPRFGYRTDVDYVTTGTYRTMSAAKAALTRAHKAWRRTADAEHHALIQSIVSR